MERSDAGERHKVLSGGQTPQRANGARDRPPLRTSRSPLGAPLLRSLGGAPACAYVSMMNPLWRWDPLCRWDRVQMPWRDEAAASGIVDVYQRGELIFGKVVGPVEGSEGPGDGCDLTAELFQAFVGQAFFGAVPFEGRHSTEIRPSFRVGFQYGEEACGGGLHVSVLAKVIEFKQQLPEDAVAVCEIQAVEGEARPVIQPEGRRDPIVAPQLDFDAEALVGGFFG